MARVTRSAARAPQQGDAVANGQQLNLPFPPVASGETNDQARFQKTGDKNADDAPILAPKRAPKRRRRASSKDEDIKDAPQKMRKISTRKATEPIISHHYQTRKRSQLPGSSPVASQNEEYLELPHNLGRIRVTKKTFKAMPDEIEEEPVSKTEGAPRVTPTEVVDQVEEVAATSDTAAKGKKGKKGMLRVSPFPLYSRPTPEECEEVHRLLTSVHGEYNQPEAIPTPSLIVTGCGEVPSVLDALIRTRLSAATTRNNSGLAFRGLVKTFGTLQEGIGKGSCDYNKVRLANVEEIFEAIEAGGLGNMKSKSIKEILQMIYEENQERRLQILAASKDADRSTAVPADQNLEVVRAEQDVLSLDHLHLMSDQDAFDALQKYPGIGVKTAACVLLFCLRRPLLSVDTHVYRLVKWLGWVPTPGPKADYVPGAKGDLKEVNEQDAFFHLDTRVPDKYKYALHQLLIDHGMKCTRCKAGTGESSEGWGKGCIIEHLVKRTGAKKEVKAKREVDAKGKVIKQSQLTFGKKVVVKTIVEEEEEEEEEEDDEFVPRIQGRLP